MKMFCNLLAKTSSIIFVRAAIMYTVTLYELIVSI